MAKQYGLSFPNKEKGHTIGQVSAIKPSVFDNDSDSEEQPVRPTGISKGIKKQDLISQEKAISDDPTVYQYDEVYDEIEKKRSESKLARKDIDKKPKYISKLLVAAEKRKRENERRIERQVQKEREEEGDMFKDKESFITPSYKKKLEEMKQLEEQEKREEYLESIGDVRKQGNLDGFYRHLFDQKVNYEEKDKIKTENEKDEEVPTTEDKIKEEQISEEEVHNKSESENIEEKSNRVTKKRKYRSRKDSENDSEEEPEVKKEHLPSNLDADSDFSVDSSDSEDDENNKKDKEEKPIKEKESNKEDTKETSQEKKNDIQPAISIDKSEDKIEEIKKEQEEEVKVKPKKPKIDIWKKRTVGEKFDEAVKRYFERKAIREMGV